MHRENSNEHQYREGHHAHSPGLRIGACRPSPSYDDLIQFQKGVKRINRLRLLAYDGLLAQSGVFAGMGRGSAHLHSASSAQDGNGDITNDLFAPAIDA